MLLKDSKRVKSSKSVPGFGEKSSSRPRRTRPPFRCKGPCSSSSSPYIPQNLHHYREAHITTNPHHPTRAHSLLRTHLPLLHFPTIGCHTRPDLRNGIGGATPTQGAPERFITRPKGALKMDQFSQPVWREPQERHQSCGACFRHRAASSTRQGRNSTPREELYHSPSFAKGSGLVKHVVKAQSKPCWQAGSDGSGRRARKNEREKVGLAAH